MFGYITPDFSSLTDDEKKRYRSWYCGLCETMGTQAGQKYRLLLSHDMTFLLILLSSVYGQKAEEKDIFCPIHPLKKRSVTETEYRQYVSRMNLLLMYYKCQDHAEDDHSIVESLGVRILRNNMEKIMVLHPRQFNDVKLCLEKINTIEKCSDTPDPFIKLDMLCNLSGEMLGTVFSYDDRHPFDPWIREIGKALGRFVYLLDAYDDLYQDIRKHRFNPLIPLQDHEQFDDFIKDMLTSFIAEGINAFDSLPCEEDQDLVLLRNVLYRGIWCKFESIKQKRSKEQPNDKRSV